MEVARIIVTFEDGSQECSSSSSFHRLILKDISQLQAEKGKLQVSGNNFSTPSELNSH